MSADNSRPTLLEATGYVLRRRWAIPLLGVALVVLGLVVARAGGPNDGFGYLGIWLGMFLAPSAYVRNVAPRAVPTAIRATGDALELAGRAPIRATDIVEARMVPRAGKKADAVAELVLRDGKRLSLWMRAFDVATLLSVLRAAPGERRASFSLAVPFGTRWLGAFTLVGLPWFAFALHGSGTLMRVHQEGFATAVVLLAVWALWVGIVCAPLAWFAGVVRGTLRVGAEGLATRWLFSERFVSFADIASIRARPFLFDRARVDTVVELRSGKRLRLRAADGPNAEVSRGAEKRAMFAHVEQAFRRFTEAAGGIVHDPTVLERGGRPVRDWLASLDGLVGGAGARYRVAALDADVLEAIASDPNGRAEARVGAAAALVRLGDEDRRTRVRLAAEACAESSLRAVLLDLSDARTDEAVEAALGRGAELGAREASRANPHGVASSDPRRRAQTSIRG